MNFRCLAKAIFLTAVVNIGLPKVAVCAEACRVMSPNHAQTFTYGTETRRQWTQRGGHLAVLIEFTNDPFVDRQNPRQYDSFRFDFPTVRLGRDGETFFVRSDDGRLLPVARRRKGFLGIDEDVLLPDVRVGLFMPHGDVTVSLEVPDPS